jgi:ADP-ribose diphosphatase
MMGGYVIVAGMSDELVTLYAGKFLRLMRRAGWEYADRAGITGIVGVVAVTEEGKLLLVEQYRTPIDRMCIEIPAGLVGDEAGGEKESLLAGAGRELLEETGYEAGKLEIVAAGPSSAGVSSEIITMVRATKLVKRSAGGGVEGEAIVVHEVPVGEVMERLRHWVSEGKVVDLKVYSGLWFARENV